MTRFPLIAIMNEWWSKTVSQLNRSLGHFYSTHSCFTLELCIRWSFYCLVILSSPGTKLILNHSIIIVINVWGVLNCESNCQGGPNTWSVQLDGVAIANYSSFPSQVTITGTIPNELHDNEQLKQRNGYLLTRQSYPSLAEIDRYC